MNNTQPENSQDHDWQMGQSNNEYYAYRQRTKRRRDAYTEEQHEILEQMEKAWKASLPVLSLKELVEIYPGSEGAAKRGLREKMRQVKKDMNSLDDFREVWHSTVINKASFLDQPELIKWLNGRVEDYLKEYENEMRKLNFQMLSLQKKDTREIAPNGITESDIAMAKQYPISSLIKVNKARKANCIFHTEKDPSMHIYKNNRFHCFSCGKSGDAIDVYMELSKLPFKEAVKKMI